LKAISIDRTSALPPWVQIKEQIKLAYCMGNLNQGDVLPSIRAFAEQLDIGEAIVRRAYQELTQTGFLSAEPRKHLMVTDSLAKPGHVEALTRSCTDECDRLIEWARENGVSPISLARLFLRRAMENEREKPAYAYVDLSKGAAESFSREISKAWEVPVAAYTIREIAALPAAELAGFAGILVNYFRHERLLGALGERDAHVFPVRVKLHERVVRKIRRQGAGSAVLLVLPAEDAARIGAATLSHIEKEVGDDIRVRASSVDDIPDLADEVESGRYRLAVVSRHIWDEIPERARRLANVVPNENQLVMESLERIRVAAGILV